MSMLESKKVMGIVLVQNVYIYIYIMSLYIISINICSAFNFTYPTAGLHLAQ